MRVGRERTSGERIKLKNGADKEEEAKSMGKSSIRLEKAWEVWKPSTESASVLLDGLNKMKLGTDY